MNLVSIFVLISQSLAAVQLSDPIKIAEQWEDEALYYQPSGSLRSTEWNGLAYSYSEKACFELSQQKNAKKVVSKKVECGKDFLIKAKENYDKFADFKQYKDKLVKCLEAQDQKCLRPLISKTMKLSFDDSGFCDRRDLAFKTWKTEDYKKIAALIRKGVVSEGDYRRFPPEPDEDGLGWRGHFTQKNGAWVLQSFVAGD